jgi:hypothetical protein
VVPQPQELRAQGEVIPNPCTHSACMYVNDLLPSLYFFFVISRRFSTCRPPRLQR